MDFLNSTAADFAGNDTPGFFGDLLKSATQVGTSYLAGQQQTKQAQTSAQGSAAAAAIKTSGTVKAILIGAGALVLVVVIALIFRNKG